MMKRIMLAVFLVIGVFGLTGCTTNDITIISENGRVKINYQDLYTKEEIEKNGSTLEELMKYLFDVLAFKKNFKFSSNS